MQPYLQPFTIQRNGCKILTQPLVPFHCEAVEELTLCKSEDKHGCQLSSIFQDVRILMALMTQQRRQLAVSAESGGRGPGLIPSRWSVSRN